MEKIYNLIVFRPRYVLLVILVLTGFFAFHARNVRFDNSVNTLLPENAPAKEFYAETREAFGSDEVGVVGVVADITIYTPQTLEKIKRLTDSIAHVDGVERVLSITNALDHAADVALPPRLIPSIPQTREALGALQQKLAERPLFLENLVSSDGRAAAINVFYADMSDEEFLERGVDEAIEGIVERERRPESVEYTGLPHLKAHSMKAMRRDLGRLIPLTLAVIAVVLLVSFRSLGGVLLPTLTVVIALAWTLGTIALTGGRLSLASIALPPLMLVLGTAYSLHVLADYRELAGAARLLGEGILDTLLDTLRKTTPPVLITALTTALGFLSLSVNPIVGIREMGIYSAIGILFAFVLSVVLIPAILAALPAAAPRGRGAFSPTLAAVLRWVGVRSTRYRGAVIATGILVSLLSAWQVFSIRVDSNFESFFREDDPAFRATEAVNRHLGGAMAFHLVVDGAEAGLLKKQESLRRIRKLQAYVESLPGVHATISLVDALDVLDRGSRGSRGDLIVTPEGKIIETLPEGDETSIWNDRNRFTTVMGMVVSNPATFSRLVDAEFSRANVLVRTSLSRSSEVNALVEKIRSYAEGHLPPELRARPTGTLVLHAGTIRNIVAGQIQSFTLAAVVIFFVMAAMFLSLRVGLIAMVPNLFPILVFFGLMGASGAILSLSTSIIASIVLGIAVDDTVHVMTRLSAEVRETGDQERAMLRTLETVGKPCVFSTAFLCLGFLSLGLSSFIPIQEFGILSAAAIFVALAGDVFLLPALIATTHIITLWDVLNVRLGKDPHQTIPVFATLRPIQAKIVTLMGELKSFPGGEPIVRQGELGNEMYVILRGSADVVLHSGDRTRRVRELGRGDVFGEMGLIRHHERTADVVATEALEVMAMDMRFLTRIGDRYPRIASKIFLNLAKILSDRLQEETIRPAR